MGLVIEIWTLFVCMKSSILDSYCAAGKITGEFPLSACVIMAPWSPTFVFMLLMALDSECVLCVCEGLLCFCKVLMRSAVSFLYTSRSEGGRCDMAVSASRARFWILFLGLLCRLYLGPFCSRAISGSEKVMSGMFWWGRAGGRGCLLLG